MTRSGRAGSGPAVGSRDPTHEGQRDAPSGVTLPPERIEDFCQQVRPRLLGALVLQYGHTVAEEVTQETLVRLYLHWQRVRTLRNPQAWAFRVAYNLGRSSARRRRIERRVAERDVVTDVVFDGTLDHTDALLLRDAVAGLPSRQRATLILRYYADLSVADVAGILGCAESTVKSNTRDALTALRRSLEPPRAERGGR